MSYARLVACLVVGIVCLSPALAQSEKSPPLKGPAVKDGSVPGEQRKFAGGGARERMQGEIPHRIFRQALDSLRGEKAGEAVRLTAEQDRRIREIEEAFFDDVAAFREKHGEEVRSLIAKMPPEDRRRAAEFLRGPGRPMADRPVRKEGGGGEQATTPKAEVDPKAAQEARERLKEIIQAAPKVGDVHAKMVAVLSEAQREALKSELDRLRKEIQKERESALQRKPGKEGEQVEGQSPAGGKKRAGAGQGEIPARLRERLKNMTPEEREEVLKRFRERQKERQPK